MSEGYEAFDDPYVYPGTSVLRNRLGIRDAAGLEGFEVEAAHFRAEEGLPEGNFDAAHFSAVHRHLFGDVYEWAGTYRTVRIAKGTTMFCYPENIPAQMDALFGGIEGGGRFRDVTVEEFVTRLAGFLAELNAIHPFREGNGRTQVSFAGLIGAASGQPLQLRRVNPRTFLPAMVASFAGDLGPLVAELRLLRG
ncbi:MAG: Fic family protein [Acidobacteriaceae bacterium]